MENKEKINALNNTDLDNTSGSFLTAGLPIFKDRYTIKQYSETCITWKQNVLLKDEYYCKGKKIFQKEADILTTAHFLKQKLGL